MRVADDGGGIQVLRRVELSVSCQWRNTVQRDARGPPTPQVHINGHPGGIQEHDQESDLKPSETTVSQV